MLRGVAVRRPQSLVTATLIGLLALAVAAGGYLVLRSSSQSGALPRASGIPADISTATANEMGLSPLAGRIAPDFRLTDQNGRMLSLSSLRGRSVVLEFMDPHCTDICPIVSQEFVDAYRDLGARAAGTAFAAVNVNRFHTSPAAMAAYSRAHGLDAIRGWHFFTGAPAALRRVWNAYGVYVYAPSANADVEHSSIVYFIDARGRERFVAVPYADHRNGSAYLPAPTLAQWGHGIAALVRDVR